MENIYIGLWTEIVGPSNQKSVCRWAIKNVWLNLFLLINWHLNECSQECQYYPFALKFNRFPGSYNALNDLPDKVCVQNKTEDLNLSVFNMITGINESKI